MPAPEVRRTRLRAARGENRAAIVAAAEAALRRRPFREVTVEEVMQDAGLARTQFYRHFDDLPDLVLRVGQDAFGALLDAHEELVALSSLDRAALEEGLRRAVEAFAEHGPLVRALGEAAIHDAAVEAVLDGVHERYVALVAGVVERAAAQGAPIAAPRETARLLHHANVAYLTTVFGREPLVGVDEAHAAVLGMWAATLGLDDAGATRQAP
ncbi:TetR/AcrR family transcriptional regulator [Paraconexibacter algicola]|uniref:TetR/AcrR family transcriptional regulator n=1 Tax=Paraconexibacter algicola TaxID=2133960 RepID=UPI0011B21AFD|nr:TetR family transcriptional regulator [Paraconexibacter algicola]